MRRFGRAAYRLWNAGWASLSSPARALLLLVLGVAVLGAVVLGAQLGSTYALTTTSHVAMPLVSIGAATLLFVAARHRQGRERAAWILFGVGVGCWGIGELVWTGYALFGLDVAPYPGLADIFYVAGYPFMFAAVLLLPHLRAGRWERIRITLDVMAGSVALTGITWTFYLRDAISFDVAAPLLEKVINLAYPAGDLILLIGLMILFTRRSDLQFDGRLLVVGAGLALTVVADMTYVLHVDNGSYVDGMAMDTMWLGGYCLFALAALLVAVPPRLRHQVDRATRLETVMVPYIIVVALFAITLAKSGAGVTILQVSTAIVGLLIIVRQGLAIRETRQIVEKQRNDLVASISHELRTPLTAMSGFMDILESDPDLDPIERVDIITIVASETKHLSRIVGDLVEIARSGPQAVALNRNEIDIAGLVATAIEMLGGEALRAQIATRIEPGLTIIGDRDRLCQALVNYLTNAIRYGNGIVEVHARSASHAALLEVHDNGPGIPKKFELAIWERFERGAHAFLSDASGSGLGLAIVRQLVYAHGGRVGYRLSERLGGACFWIALPVAEPPMGEDEDLAEWSRSAA